MIFRPAARYPADPRAVFILALSAFSGLGALAFAAAPQSLEQVVPRWGVIIWGIMLVVGSVLTLVGMARQTLNGVIMEQVGSVTVGVVTIFYSVLALVVVGKDALQPVGIILAWGISCFARWFQLQWLLRKAYRVQVAADQEADE